jgi:ABC-type transporter Mla subunit MlaD
MKGTTMTEKDEEKGIDTEKSVEETSGDTVKTAKRSGFDGFLKSAKEFVKDAKLQEKFDVLKEKTGEAVDAAAKKVDEIRHDEELKAKLNTIKDNVTDAAGKVVDKVKENEELSKTLHNVKEGVVDAAKRSAEFVHDKTEEIKANPDVQKKVEQAKDKSIDLAEKATDGLKKWLRPEAPEAPETPVEPEKAVDPEVKEE